MGVGVVVLWGVGVVVGGRVVMLVVEERASCFGD